jgi:flagellar basal body-associated protein FliL
MPSPVNQYPENSRRFDWPAIIRTLLVQVVVLLVLSGAFVGYVNWSSAKAFAEFTSATGPSAQDTQPAAPASSPRHADRGSMLCSRRV